MVNPTTVNVGIIVPLTGADVDQWGELDVNPNMVALDGLIAGVQTISAGSVPITLTAPAGFTATPGAGPTQSQNRVLRFTGTLTANVRVTLPLPGAYLIDNRTTGNFVLSFQGVTATEVVGIEQGAIVEIYNDGANVRFVNLGRVGSLDFWGGITSMPAWVTACTVRPYLLADGSIYNISDYPWLGARYLGQFGGNGVTTFGVQDLQGRMPLAYDGTGTRVTTALCGVNGQTMGAAGGVSGQTLSRAHMPNTTVAISISDPGHTHAVGGTGNGSFVVSGGGGTQSGGGAFGIRNGLVSNLSNTTGIQATFNFNGNVTQVVQNNLPPAQVSGIWVVKT